ncbi:MAG: NlpC/P60 family protein [Capsulimonadaceae bacterium]
MLVNRNVTNLYRDPDSASEVISQTILGDPVRIMDRSGSFVLVSTEDRYQGWLPFESLSPEWDDSDHLTTTIATLFAEVWEHPDPDSDLVTKLVVSSRVVLARSAGAGDSVPLVLPDRRTGFVRRLCLNSTHDGPQTFPGFSPAVTAKAKVIESIGRRAVDVGLVMVGTPYLWGGCTPFGIDCSGFVQLCYKLCGVQLLRDARLQFADARFVRIDSPAGVGWGSSPSPSQEEGWGEVPDSDQALDECDLLRGDLLAFRKPGAGRVTHIGMALGDGRFVHSSSGLGVNIAACSAEPYQSMFVGAVRLSPDADFSIDAAQ